MNRWVERWIAQKQNSFPIDWSVTGVLNRNIAAECRECSRNEGEIEKEKMIFISRHLLFGEVEVARQNELAIMSERYWSFSNVRHFNDILRISGESTVRAGE